MRPVAAAVSPNPLAETKAPPGLLRWNSPLPYLFGGLAIMMVLIAVALVILFCSSRKSADGGGDSSSSRGTVALPPLDMEPEIVVIMAGDSQPTFLAKPHVLNST